MYNRISYRPAGDSIYYFFSKLRAPTGFILNLDDLNAQSEALRRRIFWIHRQLAANLNESSNPTGVPSVLPGRQPNSGNSGSMPHAIAVVVKKLIVERTCCSRFCFSPVSIRPL